MLANIIFWTVISAIIFPLGIMTSKVLKLDLKETSIFLLIIIGLLPIIIFSILWGFFYRVNLELLIVISVSSITLYYSFWNIVLEKWQNLTRWLKGLSLVMKISLLAFIIITGIQAALPTNIPDNGYYYLQTVKWANESGIPSGVARFGFQYGQFSSWHILQALFNLSYFFGNQFNVINGWLLILIVFWATKNVGDKKPSNFYMIFVVLVAAFLQFFNTAPAPDLVVILLSLVVFKYFLFDDATESNIKIVTILTLLALMVKLSAFYLILFVILFGFKSVFRDKKLVVITVFIIALLASKNMVTTGSMIFPFDGYTPSWVSWKVDQRILDEGKTIIKNSPLVVNYSDFLNEFSVAQKVNSWFNHKGYRGLANKLWLFGILFLGIVSILYKSKNTFLIFIITTIHFSILWVLAPNYRFAIALILLIYYLMINHLTKGIFESSAKTMLPAALVLSVVWLTPLIHPLQQLSSNQIISSNYSIKPSYLLVPSLPFVSESYEKKMLNGEIVHIPPGYHYAWDGPLPCVMRSHYEKYNKDEN